MNFEKHIPIILQMGFAEARLSALHDYVNLLWKSNEELNLISRKMSFEELLQNHIVDSLLPLEHLPQNLKHVADFGSGGGLPAVIYALHFTGTEFHLFEKSPKKQDFLKLCQKIAPNIRIHGDIPLELKNIELVTARGFKPLDVILDVSRKYYERGGQYFLLKARREKIDEELLLMSKKFKGAEVEIKALKSPVLDVERNLVLIRNQNPRIST